MRWNLSLLTIIINMSATETWDKIVVSNLSPQPRSQLVSFVSPSSDIRPQLTSPGHMTGQNTPSLTRHAKAMVQRIKGEAESILDSRHGGSQRYSFLPPESCTEDSDSDQEEDVKFRRYKELPREIIRDLTRSSQFQRLESASNGDPSVTRTRDRPSSIVKDLARVNLSLLSSTGKSAYHVFNNQSSDSINTINSVHNDNFNDSLISYDLQKEDSVVTPGTITKSDSAFTWQSYSCSSRNSTLSSCYRDHTDITDAGLHTEVSVNIYKFEFYFLCII